MKTLRLFLMLLTFTLPAWAQPNVIVIFVDDLGWPDGGAAWSQQLSSLGLNVPPTTDILTPHLDQLVNHGVRCPNGYVTCPVCSPSRAGLMTGRHQQRFGYEMNPGPELEYDPVFGLPHTECTMGDRMKALGYATAWIGKSHLGALPHLHPVNRGFDEFYGFLEGHHDYCICNYALPLAPWDYVPPPWQMTQEQLQTAGLTNRALWDPIQRAAGPLSAVNEPVVVQEQDYLTTAFGREIVAYIDRHRTAHPQQPFFIYAPFNAVHEPVQITGPHLVATAGLFPPAERGGTRHKLAAMLYGIDEAVGMILAKLRSYDLGGGRTLENETLIVFSSDNGAPPSTRDDANGSVSLPLRGNKSALYEGGIRVPYVMQWLDMLPPGNFLHPVSTMDVLPTCVAAAGASIPAAWQLDGVNLLPHFLGTNPNPPHAQMYWRVETGRAEEMEPGPKAMRQGNWKIIKPDWAKPWELYDLSTEDGLHETDNKAAIRPDKLRELIPVYQAWEATLPRPRWDYRDPNYVTPTFVLDDVRVGSAAASVIAPEFYGSQVAWQDAAGVLWSSALDLSTGFPSGVPVQITTGLAAPSAQNEGVQWGVSAAGASLFYTKPGAGGRLQLWRNLTPLTTSTTLDSTGARVSQEPAAAAVGMVYRRGAEDVVGFDSAPALNIALPDQAPVERNGRWIPGTQDIVYVRTGSPHQLARFNPSANTTVTLTDDGGDKTDACAFLAPEYGYELCYACVVDCTGIAIYRDLKRGGGFYDRVATLTVPATEAARVLLHMKPLSGLRGFNGVSWFSCAAWQTHDALNPGASAVWLLGLGTDPAHRLPLHPPPSGHNDLCREWKSYALRVSDPLAAGVASEPETVIGTREVFCFYSRRTSAGPVQLWRARTGLVKPDAPASGFASLNFERDFTPGSNDDTNQRRGGTETTALVAHEGKLFAATSSRGDSTTANPLTFTGAQILVKDTALTPWRLDTAGGTTALFADHIAADVLTELTITRNGSTPIPEERRLFLGLRDIGSGIGSHLASARVRVGPNDWRHSTVTTTLLSADPVHVMSFAVHRDGEEEFVFAGLSNGEIYRAVYDPLNTDRLVWNPAPDLAQNPAAKLGPVTALAEANGALFAACGIRQDSPGDPVAGGLYARDDTSDSWVNIYTWPTPLPAYSAPESQRSMTSLTAVPDPRGCAHDVLLAARSWPGIVELIDPARAAPVNRGPTAPVTVELDVRDFFARLWNDDTVRSQAITLGYTPFTPATDPVTGQRVWLLGVWLSSRPGTYFLLRHFDGTWEAAGVPGASFRASRCFAVSPFAADAGAAFYFGGYDAASTAAHDTAWIARGTWNDWPALTFAPDGTGLQLTWPPTGPGWIVESSTNLSTWSPHPAKPARSLTGTSLSLEPAIRAFFRLTRP